MYLVADMYYELINYGTEESTANGFIKLAYNLWNTVLKYCYTTLRVNPTKWGGKTSLLSQITSGRVESIIIAVATGILILVFVVGVLREGGHIISEKGQPYGVISLMLRFFISAALIRGYPFITSTIFDVFTAAINGLGIGSGKEGYGLVNPDNAGQILPKGSSQSIGDIIFNIITNPLGQAIEAQKQMLRMGLIEILGLIYMLIIVVCAFVVFFKVYGRYFKCLICIILAPIGFALYASPMTEQQAKKFLFYLVKLGAEGLIMALILVLYDTFIKSGKAIIPDFINALTGAAGKEDLLSTYVAFMVSQIFFCILLVSLISASEKIAEELL